MSYSIPLLVSIPFIAFLYLDNTLYCISLFVAFSNIWIGIFVTIVFRGAYPIQMSQYLQREIPVQLRLFENIMNEKEVIRYELIHVQFKPHYLLPTRLCKYRVKH